MMARKGGFGEGGEGEVAERHGGFSEMYRKQQMGVDVLGKIKKGF